MRTLHEAPSVVTGKMGCFERTTDVDNGRGGGLIKNAAAAVIGFNQSEKIGAGSNPGGGHYSRSAEAQNEIGAGNDLMRNDDLNGNIIGGQSGASRFKGTEVITADVLAQFTANNVGAKLQIAA